MAPTPMKFSGQWLPTCLHNNRSVYGLQPQLLYVNWGISQAHQHFKSGTIWQIWKHRSWDCSQPLEEIRFYRNALFRMTLTGLSDMQDHSLQTFSYGVSYSCTTADKISTDIACRAVPLRWLSFLHNLHWTHIITAHTWLNRTGWCRMT